jgi:hypothetical protein
MIRRRVLLSRYRIHSIREREALVGKLTAYQIQKDQLRRFGNNLGTNWIVGNLTQLI